MMARPAAMNMVQSKLLNVASLIGKTIRSRSMIARGIVLVMVVSEDLRGFMRTALFRSYLGHK